MTIEGFNRWVKHRRTRERRAARLAPSGPPPLAPPAAPSSLAVASISASQLNQTWADNSSAPNAEDNFELERSPNGTSSWVQIATPAANATTYSNTGLSASTLYYYRVRAVNAAGPSAWSNVASRKTRPTKATNVTAVALGPTSVRVTWTDNAPDETSQAIRRATSVGGPYSEVGTVGANVTTFDDTGLTSNTAYYYEVVVSNDEGAGAASDQTAQSTVTTHVVPTDVTGLLLWVDPVQETGYTDGQSITTVTDRGPNAYTVTKNGTDVKMKVAGIAGKRSLDFTGGRLNVTGGLNGGNNFTQFFIVEPRANDINGLYDWAPSQTNVPRVFSGNIEAHNGPQIATAGFITANKRYMVEVTYTIGASRQIRVRYNGGAEQSATQGITTAYTWASNPAIGAINATTSPISALLGDPLVYSGDLAEADRAKLRDYLWAKWGLAGLAPVYNSLSALGSGASTSRAVTKPAGVADRWGMLALVRLTAGGTQTVTPPANWVRLGGHLEGAHHLDVWAKTATSADDSIADYTFSWPTSVNNQVVIYSFRPMGRVGVTFESLSFSSYASTTTHTMSSITSGGGRVNTRLIGLYSSASGAHGTTADPAMTQHVSNNNAIVGTYALQTQWWDDTASGTRQFTTAAAQASIVALVMAHNAG